MNWVNKETPVTKDELDAQMIEVKIGIIQESIKFWEKQMSLHSDDEQFVRKATNKLKEEKQNLDELKNKHPEFFI